MKKELEEKLIEIGYLGKTDLNTIWSALPWNETYSRIMEGDIIRVVNVKTLEDIECKQQPNESLTDTAARLLLKLVEAGIVKFNN